MTSLNLEGLVKNSLIATDAEFIKALKDCGFTDVNNENSYHAYANLFPQKVSYYDGQLIYRKDDRKIAFAYNVKAGLSSIENIRLFNRVVSVYDKLKDLGLLYKTFFELYSRDPKAVIYRFRLTDYPDYPRQIIINLDGYTIYDDATDKFVVLAEPSELSERLETLNLVVHLINHPNYQEAQQKLHTLEPGETAEQLIKAIDALRQEQQKLDDQIAKLRARQIAIDQNITDLEQLEREERIKVESKRITAFLNEHPELTYKITHDDKYFYTDLNSDVYMRYNYPNSELTLEKAFEDIERYLQILPILQADKTLLGNIADSLERLNSDITYNVRLNPNKTITVHVQDFDTWYNHQDIKDDITVSYGYPDDDEPLTVLFDLEETYDGSDGFAELPQKLRDMTDRIATLKKTTKGDSNDD